MKLTAASVKKLQCRHPGGTWYSDDSLPGFAAVVYPSGRIHFRARYTTHDGRRRKVDVGRLGHVTVEEAREAAHRILAQATVGEDPAAMREKVRATPTFAVWRERYLSRLQGRRVSLSETARYLSIAVERWGDKRLHTITRTDVETLYQTIGETHAHPTSANRFRAAVSACFTMAVRESLIPANPAANLLKFTENPPRARVLTAEEMSRLVTGLQDEDEHTRAAFSLLIGSGLRLSEALRAKWEDLDLEAATLRLPRPKSQRVEMVPIPQTTLGVLSRLARSSDFIVAGAGTEKPRLNLRGAWQRLRVKAALSDVRIHDLRRSFGLAVARQSGLHVASKLLRHRDIRITQAVYAPLDMDLLRDAVEKRQDALPFAVKKKSG